MKQKIELTEDYSTNFEYYVQEHQQETSDKDLVEQLNSMGALGWELSGVFGNKFIFKRLDVEKTTLGFDIKDGA